MKIRDTNTFLFLFKTVEIYRGGGGGGYNLGSGKQFLAIKVSFRINKPGFRGLMEELATRALLGRPTFMT